MRRSFPRASGLRVEETAYKAVVLAALLSARLQIIRWRSGWLSKSWSLFGVLIIIRHLIFRVAKMGP